MPERSLITNLLQYWSSADNRSVDASTYHASKWT